MPNFTPEVRNGKPSQLAKKVILGVSIAFLTSCTPTGKAFVQSTAYETFNYGIQRGIDSEADRQRREELKREYNKSRREPTEFEKLDAQGFYDAKPLRTESARDNLNPEERAILEQVNKMPRVVYKGDVDNNGVEDWIYHDGKGNQYWAFIIFKNDKDVFALTKKREFSKRSFVYNENQPNEKQSLKDVPNNVLEIWYQK